MRAFAIAAMAAAVAGSPSCGAAVPAGPPELRLGTDMCDGCGMAIAESRHAAAVLADGDDGGRHVLKFDDIGCLALWEARARGRAVRKRWVHDSSTGQWIDAAAASYVQSRDVVTPMGSGLVAFERPTDAEALAAENGGGTLSWSAILARARDGSLRAQPDFGRGEAR